MTIVWLVQHAEKIPGTVDPALTPTGMRQATAVAARLASERVTAVRTSPARRAAQTALPIARRCGLIPLRVDIRLRERIEFRGDPADAELAGFFRDWMTSTADRSFRSRFGDSSIETGRRMRDAVLSAAREETAPALVTHGGATIDLLRDLLGDSELESRAPGLIVHGVPGAALTQLAVGDTDIVVESIGTTSHLDPTDLTGHVPGPDLNR